MIDRKLALENWQYYLGNHRQFYNGKTLPKEDPNYQTIEREISRLFNSYNICSEIVEHYTNTLVGKPFNWSVKDKDGHVCESARQILAQWLEWQSEMSIELDLGDPLANAVTQMLVTDRGNGIGTGYLRVYSPPIFSNLEPFQQVLFHSPNPEQIEIKRDCYGTACQANYISGEGQVETYTLLNDGTTAIESNDTKKVADYGGRLPVFALNGKCLITNAIKSGQKSINNTLTYKAKNIEAAGFVQRTVFNGLPPGQWRENPQTGDLELIVDSKPLDIGNGITTFISGIPIGDPQNPRGYTKASIDYRNPVPISSFIESIKLDTSTIYYQAGLAYSLDSDLAGISGASRQSLKEDFLCRVRVYQRTIEGTLKRLFSIVINTLAPFYPVLEGCQPAVKLNLAVTASISERQENSRDVTTGVMSIPTAIANNGLDVACELESIRKYAHLVNNFR